LFRSAKPEAGGAEIITDRGFLDASMHVGVEVRVAVPGWSFRKQIVVSLPAEMVRTTEGECVT
jgi:hypothetical protein